MTELYDEFFSMLRFAKRLYEYGTKEQIKRWFSLHELDGENYWELAYDAISWVFLDTRRYYNERDEIEIWLFVDPAIDRFCQLCQEYEQRWGISEEKNQYRRDMEQIIHEGFSFNSWDYNYSWRLSVKNRGCRCLILFTGGEFYGHDEIFEGLMEIRDGFDAITARIEAELAKETRIMPLPLVTAAQWKEAA